MKIMIILLGILINTCFAQSARHNIIFEMNKYHLDDEHKEEIKKIIGTLNHNEEISIYPLVHDPGFNRLVFDKNASKQAAEIADYAQSIGFILLGSPTNFPSTYRGRGRSIALNLKYEDPNFNPPKKRYTLKEKYPEKPSQFFTINPKRDTLIVGDEGTVLYLDAGCLISKQPVKIELKEFYSLADYMKNDMPTVSNNRFIETGGSIYLNATNHKTNQQVKINPNKGIGVDFTIGKNDPEMEIFVKDTYSKEMNWVLPPKATIESSWQMTETILDENGNVIDEKIFTSKADWEKYQQDQLQQKKAEKLEKLKRGDLSIFNLGYINCDRFPNEILINYSLAVDAKIPAEYYLIYIDVRGVMKAEVKNGIASFGSVPSSVKATLMAVSFIDDQAHFFESALVANNPEKPIIILQKVEESIINQKLSALK